MRTHNEISCSITGNDAVLAIPSSCSRSMSNRRGSNGYREMP